MMPLLSICQVGIALISWDVTSMSCTRGVHKMNGSPIPGSFRMPHISDTTYIFMVVHKSKA